jgi:hypothetical protein
MAVAFMAIRGTTTGTAAAVGMVADGTAAVTTPAADGTTVAVIIQAAAITHARQIHGAQEILLLPVYSETATTRHLQGLTPAAPLQEEYLTAAATETW